MSLEKESKRLVPKMIFINFHKIFLRLFKNLTIEFI